MGTQAGPDLSRKIRPAIAVQQPGLPTLVDELLDLSTDPLALWREKPQDDLLFAIAIAASWIERGRRVFRIW
jgi:hypothetical protein